MCMFLDCCTSVFNVPDKVPGSSWLIGMSTIRGVARVLIDYRSGSMDYDDLRPLPNTPATPTIRRYNDNRLGAVYSSLHGFWTSRHAAANAIGQNAAIARRDAYSVILFDNSATTCISNDFTSSPDDLLNGIVAHCAGGGTNYTGALAAAQSLIVQHWSNERCVAPVCRYA